MTLRENMGRKQRVMRRAEDSKYWHILGACIHAELKHEDRAEKKNIWRKCICASLIFILCHMLLRVWITVLQTLGVSALMYY